MNRYPAGELLSGATCNQHGWFQPCPTCAAMDRRDDEKMGNSFALGYIMSGLRKMVRRKLLLAGIHYKTTEAHMAKTTTTTTTQNPQAPTHIPVPAHVAPNPAPAQPVVTPVQPVQPGTQTTVTVEKEQ